MASTGPVLGAAEAGTASSWLRLATRVRRWLQAALGLHPAPGVLGTVQVGIALFVLPLAALGVVLTATDVTVREHRILGAGAALAVLWWMWWRCARGHRSTTFTYISESALIFVALLLEGKGAWAFSTLSAALFLRAAFGTHRDFVLRGAWWSVAVFASAVPREVWDWAPWWLRVVDTLWFPPCYLLAGGLIRVVVSVLERHDKALARERILLGAGVALVSSTSREDVYQVALDAVVELVENPDIEAEINEQTVDGSIHVASRRRSDPPAEAEAAGTYEMRLEIRQELVSVITVKSAAPLPRDAVDALGRLESSLALAIRTTSLTEELRRQAHYDSLTGLANRALLYERLQQALHPGQTETIAALLLDLDGFKNVNDTLGHEGGDALLAHVGRTLRASVRDSDIPARLGGDEFAVLLIGVDGEEAALATADRIVGRLSTPVSVAGTQITPRGSIGVAVWDGVSGPEELLRSADAAMYSAKSAGKDRSHMFRRSMLHEARQRRGVEADLRDALGRGELACHYQPIFDVHTGAVDSVEALVRWRRPGHGLVLPGEFLKVAEDGGLMPRLGHYVLSRSLEDFAAWQADDGFEAPRRLSVNLSPPELDQRDLVARVERALNATGVEPASLILELSEATVLDGKESIVANLQALRSLGVELALDDFGRGQSSLAYLLRFPIQILKIDQAFVADIGRVATEAELTGGIIDIGRRLHLTTVAEGVEKEEQLDRLRQLGCDLAQGYLFAPPLADADLRSLLARPTAA